MRYLLLLALLVSPLSSFARCFERYYSQSHLKKYPNQQIRNIQLDFNTKWDSGYEKARFEAKVQITMKRKGKTRLAEATAVCPTNYGYNNDQVTCTFEHDKSSTITLKKHDKYDALVTLSPKARFKEVTQNRSGKTLHVPSFDSKFGLYKNARLFENNCEDALFYAGRSTTPRLWNEVVLHSIRNDLARPTVTARNLFHLSATLWDTYAAFDRKLKGYFSQLKFVKKGAAKDREIALHYAAYTFLKSRYELAPGNKADNLPYGEGESGNGEEDQLINELLNRVMKKLGLDPDYEMKKSLSDPASLGIRIAKDILRSQRNDGSRESTNHDPEPNYPLINNFNYLDITLSGIRTPLVETETPSNEGSTFEISGGENFADKINIDYWLPLYVPGAIDQGGNSQGSEQSPLTLFWGKLKTFANLENFLSKTKPGVYFDPGAALPSFTKNRADFIRQNLEVAAFSRLLNPVDLVKEKKDFDGDGKYDHNPGADFIDISPGTMGNNTLGANDGRGRKKNPVTGRPYAKNLVKQADFGRAIAEFWADGPDSETPPGHWNTLMNYVIDRMAETRTPYRWSGKGPVLSREQYELMLALTLNGALHDAAVVAWGIKGHYQGNRPITVIRKLASMAESDPSFAAEIQKISPDLKMVTYQKSVRKKNGERVKKTVTKLVIKSWRGAPMSIAGDSDVQHGKDLSFRYRNALAEEEESFYQNKYVGGTGWILADNWIPYQKITFVTPPFPGFVSGHSTFSRAAAEVLAHITGSEYFPGGLGTYKAPRLQFEDWAKSSDFDFHWATYYDASDQSGISRIYGGIHASYDDLPARKIGSKIGIEAVKRAQQFFRKR